MILKNTFILSFTEKVNELVSSGLSLQKSFLLLEKISGEKKELSLLCNFLHTSLAQGKRLSVALAMNRYLAFPDWYLAYITVAEECGCINQVLAHLIENLQKRSGQVAKCIDSLLYPLSVVLLTALAGFLSVFFLLPSFYYATGGNCHDRSEQLSAMLMADFFLFSFFMLLLLAGKKVFAERTIHSVISAIAFLTERNLPTIYGVKCAFVFSEKDKKIASALHEIQQRLFRGEKTSSSFADCFSKNGYRREGLLLAENLLLGEQTGSSVAFKKTAEILRKRQLRREKAFLSMLQPLIFFAIAVYSGSILKVSLLPFITDFGGIL